MSNYNVRVVSCEKTNSGAYALLLKSYRHKAVYFVAKSEYAQTVGEYLTVHEYELCVKRGSGWNKFLVPCSGIEDLKKVKGSEVFEYLI